MAEFEFTPGARAALGAHPLGQMILRADPRLEGGQTGVPAMQQMMSGNIDVAYGVRLPDALLARYTLEYPTLQRILSLGSVTRPERAAVYGIMGAADFTGSAQGDFTIGGDPPGVQVGARTWGSVVKKSYGAMGAITDVDWIASGASGYPTIQGPFNASDDRSLLLQVMTRKTLTALNYSVVKGNEGTRPTQFNGIETALTYDATNRPFVVDRAGATTGNLDALYNLILKQLSYGVRPTELWMHPVTKEALLKEYLAASNINLNVTSGDQGMTLGQEYTRIVTPAGPLPIIEDFSFTLAGTGSNLSGDIFVVTTRSNEGVPLMGFEWQVPLTAIEPLARVPGFYTSQVMGVWCHGVLIERSNWWAQGRLRNVGMTYYNATTYALQTRNP